MTSPRPLLLALRIVIVIIGGYALMAGFAGFAGVGLARIGMAGSEAVLLAAMLSFPLYLGVILWGFHESSLWRIALTILGGAGASIALAIALAPPTATG
jgi:hypothetical protein